MKKFALSEEEMNRLFVYNQVIFEHLGFIRNKEKNGLIVKKIFGLYSG